MRTAYCFDMDGTVTMEEVLPILARELGIEPEISVLTQATINGLLPFDQSFALRVRLLSQVPILKVKSIIRAINLNPTILFFLQSKPSDCFIVTGNLDVWIEDLMKYIGCEYFSSTAKLENGEIVGITKILNKASAIQSLRDRGYNRVVTIGDGMNDVSMFEQADVRIAYGGVHQPVDTLIKTSDYVTFSGEALCNILNKL